MNKKLISLFTLAGLFSLASFAFADQATLTNYGPGDFPTLIAGITRIFSTIVGGLATIMFIVSGILFVTSGGSATQIQKAKTALFYAIGGMAVALLASAMVNFVSGVMA
jgi:hypothetical protein